MDQQFDYLDWDDLDERGRKIIQERIASGELPRTFRVTEYLYYVGRRLEHLSPTPITRAARPR
jgi:hypothetical protein